MAVSLALLTAGTSLARADDVPAADVSASSGQSPADPVVGEAMGTAGENGAATGTAAVITGDATGSADVQNTVNENVIAPPADTATASTLSASTTNDAVIGTDSSTTAETGGNGSTGGGGAAVSSGDALASANVINVANTNIFDSEGLLLFLTQLFGSAPDLRTLDLSYFFGSGTTTCTFVSCGASNTANVIDTNAATITNEILVRANTGGNDASSTIGDASVGSGNAYAAANLVNLVNSNIIDSKYLLVSFTNFGDLYGDITLPDADFFRSLFAQGAAFSGDANAASLATDNAVSIGGTTTAQAQSGDNLASTTATSTVSTGPAYAAASTFTQANTTAVGGTSVYLLFRVWGDWTGSVQGLPDGLSWQQTPSGIVISGENAGAGPATLLGGSSNALAATTTNAASLTNNVHVYALTGSNRATSESGAASVTSGAAYAAANVVNMVNTTILGRNWIFAIFNIFGDWHGNISFGKPDLWLGASAEAASLVQPGNEVTYRFTLANKGDADATDAKLSLAYDPRGLTFLEGTDGAEASDGLRTIALGTLRRGETRDITLRATMHKILRDGVSPVSLEATLTSAQTDNDPADNTDSLTVPVGDPPPLVGGIGPGRWAIDPKVTVEKKGSVRATVGSTTVDYTVTVRNAEDAGPAFLGTLSDELVGPDGEKVFARTWKLGTIEPGDELRLTYTVALGSSTPLGSYSGTALVKARKKNPVDLYAVDMPAVDASSTLDVVPRGRPIVVPADYHPPVAGI